MNSWTAEEKAAYYERVSARQQITDAGTKALHKALRKNLKNHARQQFESFISTARPLDLWAVYDMFTTAAGDCLFEGLRSVLWVRGTKVLWDSFEDDARKAEPGDDNVYAGKRSANIIYHEQAAADTSWINETPEAETFELVAGT